MKTWQANETNVSIRPVLYGFWVVVIGVRTRFFETLADAEHEAEMARTGLRLARTAEMPR